MNMCRTCLKTPADRDMSELEKDINEERNNYLDIVRFCLDIKVTQDSKITTKLCNNCYHRIISFYKFKCLSLKNDSYLKSLNPVVALLDQKISVYVDDNGIKHENPLNSDEYIVEGRTIEIKQELDVKDEDSLGNVESDEELLSVLQKIKYENIKDETKENAPVHKKRGRPKKIKPLNAENKAERQVCEECGKSVRNLKEHAVLHLPKSERKLLQCKECPKVFSSYGARHRHYKTKHLGVKYECDICHKKVVSLPVHKRRMHDPDSLPFACASCGRRFTCRSALELHTVVHTKNFAHECDICHKMFKGKIHVALHKRQVHDKEKSHLCQFCSKTFFKKYHLQVHLRSHTKEKPYECTECGKRFSCSTTLKSHKLIHSSDKSFHCLLCDMSFKKHSYLRVHMISHTRERKHPCQYCGISFGRSDHRRRHEFTAHQKHLLAE